MSSHCNPNIVEDGLVFLYDVDDIQSYKGEPTENLTPVGDRTLTTALQRQSYHIAPWTYSLETNINGRADVLKIYINPTGSESSQPYADFGLQAYKSGGSQIGDVYAVTFDYYVTKSTNTPSLLVAYANGHKSPTSAAAASLGTITTTDLGNGWVRATRIATITTAGNTHWRFGLNSNYNETEVYVDNFQVELKSHATPFVDGTRSATQGLLDRTGTTTIDISNVSFDSNAQMVFDGTDDYLDCGNIGISSSKVTFAAWIKFSGSSTEHIIDASGNACHLAILGNKPYFFNGATYHTDADVITNGVWYYLTGVQSDTNDIYINGVLSSSKNSDRNISVSNVNIGRWQNGGRYFNGDIAFAQIYNRALTAAEVLQNYKSTKSRFNL